MKRTVLFILLTLLPILGEESWEDIFPLKHRALFMLKGGYSKDRSSDEAMPLWAFSGEFRFRTWYYEKMGGGYFQIIAPAALYHFPSKGGVLAEVRVRPNLGPPLARWIPNGMVDIGYSWGSKDWFTGHDDRFHALTIGGWFMVPLKIPDDGIFMISGARSVAGDELIRFSCYTHWFFTDHIGMSVHGDNFRRKRDGKENHYGSMNVGVLVRL